MPFTNPGAVVKRTWLLALPRLAPVKLTVPPLSRVRLVKVSAAFWPLPGVMAMVEAPPADVTEPSVSEEAALPLPTKLSVPPFSVTGTALAMRSGFFVPVLSSNNLPPWFK